MTIMNILTALAVVSVFSVEVKGACELASRIKYSDSDVFVSQNNQTCTLTLTAKNNKEVVIVMYDTGPDCIGKATVAIYDGRSTSDRLITKQCQAQPWSFASRTKSLTLTPTSEEKLRPFSLDVHAIDAVKVYMKKTGIITSQRYLGEISGEGQKNTTPNNFHGIYQVIAKTDVTMLLTFKEFRVNRGTGSECNDFIKVISSMTAIRTLCGDNELPHPIQASTYNLTIEFITDVKVTYTGFQVEYNVCISENNNTNGLINFQAFAFNKTQCAYLINFERHARITFSMTFSGGGLCADILKISYNGNTSTPSDCSSDDEYNGSFEASGTVILRFTLKKGQSVTGDFSTGTFDKKNVNGNENGISNDHFSSTASGINDNNVVIPVVVSLLTAVVVVVTVIVIVVLRRRLQNEDKTCAARYKTDMDDVEVYEDNADYDQLHQNRDHKPTSNDKNSNIYGATSSHRDVYAVVNKTKKGMDLQPTEEYDQQEFGNEYDETVKTKSNISAKNENLYE